MPTYRVAIDINVPPVAAFTYVADLPRHSEWTSDPTTVVAEEAGPMTVGSRYQSTTLVKGRALEAVLIVTDYNPPNRFAFAVRDGAGDSDHLFIFQGRPGGTHLEQVVHDTLSLSKTLIFWLTYRWTRQPNAHKAMQRLKERLEAGPVLAEAAAAEPAQPVGDSLA